MPKNLVIDLDGTLAITEADRSYDDLKPNSAIVSKLREYRDQGYSIIIYTSRNMRTYGGQIGKINAHTLPVILGWLNQHKIPYDEIHIGKPWCSHEGFYVDDKTIRPSEFLSLSAEEIKILLK